MNYKLAKALTVIIGGFLVVSAVIYYVNNGFAMPEPVEHAYQKAPKQVTLSFDGAFGTFDKASVQRGYQVYKEVCASCHSMKLISFRDLKDIGLSDAEVKAIAATYTYKTIGDDGSIIDRPGTPNDKFPSPFDNKQAAAAANGGAVPPDLSLMIKAREDGANYVYSLLTGYGQTPPADLDLGGKSYNPYFPNYLLSMAAPLQADQVTYQDGTKATLDQEARDVVNFLQWAAEPEMEQRKRMGTKAIIFLAVMTVFFYVAKVRVWAKVK